MPLQDRHPTDHDLLQGVDKELPALQQAIVDQHLADCEMCRRRHAAIAETAGAATSEYRMMVGSGSDNEERSRARLKMSLERAEEASRSWSAGVDQMLMVRRVLTCAAALAVVAVFAGTLTSIMPGVSRHVTALAGHEVPLPVASITPGATWEVTAEDLCAGTRHTRTISAAMRAQVVSAYGVEHVPPDQYELDYLITPELGGATDVRNLWPQAYASPVWNARVKDELESLLPRLVCGGRLDLEIAQRDMAVDWIAAYKKYFNTDQPLQAHRGPARDDDDDVYTLADARPAPAVRLVSLAVLR